MARLARVVVPGLPHHVTQRGNRRGPTFFEERDYRLYRDLLGAAASASGTAIWAYCLMPNHVHVIATPRDASGLRRTFADLHRRYTRAINARNGWTGHLWQARFGSVPMDEDHLAAALRYVSLNPVRAHLVERAEDWPWSSVRAHLSGRDDGLVTLAPVLARTGSFATFLDQPYDEPAAFDALRRAETIGRPLGSDTWIRQIERDLARPLAPRKPGPKAKTMSKSASDAQGDLLSKLSP